MLVDKSGERRCPVEIIEKLRRLACVYAEKNLFKSSIFWADKVVTLNVGNVDDLFLFARALYQDTQFARAAEVILRKNLHQENDACRCLAADALRRCKSFSRAEAVLLSNGDDEVADQLISHDRASRLTGSRTKSNSVQYNSPFTSFPPVVSRFSLPNSGIPGWSPNFGKRLLSSTPKDAATPHTKANTALNISSSKRGMKPASTFTCAEEAWGNTQAMDALLRAEIAEGAGNLTGAAEYYKEALCLDPFCQEAFQALIRNHMLNPTEELQLLDSINWSNFMTDLEANFVKSLYSLATKRVDMRKDVIPIPEVFLPLMDRNNDVMIWRAKHLFADCDYRYAFKLIKAVLNSDPHHPDAIPVYLASLVELKEANELYRVAHELVDMKPEDSLSWFAVGCYYYVTEKLDLARRYLLKATTIDKNNGAAWLMFGHAFAVDSEHDQSMSAYYKAHHIMKGCHLPLLYVGLGYENSKSYALANEFFVDALAIAPNDPFVLHELGVVCYREQKYVQAEKYMRKALAQVDRSNRATPFPEKWEPLLNNLGHVCRKLEKFEEAAQFHCRALSVKPKNASTYAALGYLMAWKGQLWNAASMLHQALALRRGDILSAELLNYVIEKLAQAEEETLGRGDGAVVTEESSSVMRSQDKEAVAFKIRAEQDEFRKYALSKSQNQSGFLEPMILSQGQARCSSKLSDDEKKGTFGATSDALMALDSFSDMETSVDMS
ncbi:unnamed protein product [Notodromas monacha]|uniref:Uncharacterized protein n=1 Tax=Notodromas monacha TaxID=399045 RepID=A0A7R9G9C3_9CRUS|nr:unnamed protein product [Notodromas monacha]CAG0914121.1 unnamed protein product [Notodromas monacha]